MAGESANTVVQNWLSQLEKALKNNDSSAAAELFAEESYWRDFVSFTWNLKTLEGREQIKAMLDEWERRAPGRRQKIFKALTNTRPSHLLDPALFDFAKLDRSANKLDKT